MSYSKDTIKYFNDIKNFNKNVDLENAILIDLDELIDLEKYDKQNCIVEVLDIDSFEASRLLIDKYKTKPLVLNLASDYNPGGGWRKNATAQEEVLFYRSSYALSLEPMKKYYPLKSSNIIYSDNVFVFKDTNYELLPWEKCYTVSCLAVPGLRNPNLVNNKLSSKDRMILRKKIGGIFRTAIQYNHKYLVLGALGCGAFHNPPECVANEFNKILQLYKQYFHHIIFAILSTRDTRNYDAFKKIIDK